MTIALRKGPSGPITQEGAIASGTFVGTWDGITFDPALVFQKIVTGFRPKTVQLVARLTIGPDTGTQMVRVTGMTGTFLFTAFAFTLIEDTSVLGPGFGLINFEDDGFTAGAFANYLPGFTDPGPPPLPDFYAYLVTG